MRETPLTPAELEHARVVCTKREYDALRLHNEGFGYRRIALTLNISPTAVRDALARAERRLKEEAA